MAPPCPGLVVLFHVVRDEHHSLVVCDVFDDAARHLTERSEVAKPLKRLQQNQEPDPGRFAEGEMLFKLRLRSIQIDQLSAADVTFSLG